ncbi:hypothetical protein tb265_00410 [Gemmatimonadetes bacterium T265]|nr:hypothetical protein tb265_00410 [Gemmatimonadetes bacterium T265]
MAEQTDIQDADEHWYALISASPRPETGESANVGLVVGNGTVAYVDYLPHLPRLCGLAATDEVRVYEQLLAALAESVRRRERTNVADFPALLGPQLTLEPRRRLYRQPNDNLIRQMQERFLAAARPGPLLDGEDALVARSVAQLDEQLAAVRRRGVLVYEDVRPRSLYEGKLDRYVPFRVPKLARALRGARGDVLIDSLAITADDDTKDVRAVAFRIAQAFYTYQVSLKPIIRAYAAREIRTVGVLQRSSAQESIDTAELREFVRDAWGHHGEVIDGNATDATAALDAFAAWAEAP